MRYFLVAVLVAGLVGCTAPRGACSLVCDAYVKSGVTYETVSSVEQGVSPYREAGESP